MATLAEPELPDYIFNDLFPMENEISNWVNHDFWYTNQCIDHYDADRFASMELALPPATDANMRHLDQAAVSPLSSFSSASVASCPHQASLNNLLVVDNQSLSRNTVPALSIDADNSIPALYIVDSERMFVTSPSISIQSSVSNVLSESACSSPTASASLTPNSDCESIFLQDNQMINYLRTDKGIAAFAKAHDIHKDDLLHFLEMKKQGEDIDLQCQKSPSENDEKQEGGNKRRRHRGTYSKNTCLQVIEFVKKGYSARAAAKKFGIPKSTVHNWLHEDVSTRPEKGHRKKDLYHDKHDEGEHEYQKNVAELGTSLAQTSIKDESSSKSSYPFGAIKNEETVKPRPREAYGYTQETGQESQLVKLLTTDKQMAKIKCEPMSDDIAFDNNESYFDIDCNFDELLHPEDWIEHEQWYKQQYLHHYDHLYKDNLNAKNRKCYGSYSNEHRMKATEYVRSGNTLSAASKEFRIPKSTIHTWLNEGNTPCELPAEVESAVVDEIEQVKDGETSPNLIVIKKKAEEVAAPRIEKFRASFAWCRDFMKRHYMDKSEAVDSKRICRDSGDHKPCINDLVSVLGLAPNNPVTDVAGSMIS